MGLRRWTNVFDSQWWLLGIEYSLSNHSSPLLSCQWSSELSEWLSTSAIIILSWPRIFVARESGARRSPIDMPRPFRFKFPLWTDWIWLPGCSHDGSCGHNMQRKHCLDLQLPFFLALWTSQGIITCKQGWINRRYVSQVNGRQENANMRDYTTTTIQIVLKRERSALQL